MKRLEWLKDNTVELTEEQKEFDVYDDELLNNILNTPKSEPKPANELDDMQIQLADDDEMDDYSGNQIRRKRLNTRNTTYQKIIKQSPTDTQ